MAWITAPWETLVSIAAFLWATWKAWKRGTLNTFLVTKVEGLATKQEKDAIKADAIGAGVQGVLGKVVANAGLSSTKTPATGVKKLAQVILPLLLGAVLLGGCVSIEPYRLAVRGMADTGDEVRPLVRSPLTPGEQALVDAWDFQRQAGHKLADGK